MKSWPLLRKLSNFVSYDRAYSVCAVWAVPYRLHKRKVFNWTFWVVVLLAIALGLIAVLVAGWFSTTVLPSRH